MSAAQLITSLTTGPRAAWDGKGGARGMSIGGGAGGHYLLWFCFVNYCLVLLYDLLGSFSCDSLLSFGF